MIFLINAATAFFTPTYDSTIPKIVGREHYVKALPVFALLWFLNGVGQTLIAILCAMLLAEHTTKAERGKAYAAYFALTHAFWLITYPAIGHGVSRLEAPLTFTVSHTPSRSGPVPSLSCEIMDANWRFLVVWVCVPERRHINRTDAQ